ncbi:two component response regulator [Leptospira ryugenii]|uniref:histidine kinase n=1 Tax=Leptospira ryugenii TaxID=1917863 RepID=A0A2P2E356_9LEPT|nr:PAS domain-containing sensor histidine kinase [Leptospira ryugenii]GBF51256.1 two component response regulator [Leptospira ryugenii]
MERIWQNPSLFSKEEILRELESILRSNPDYWIKFTTDGTIVDHKPSRYLRQNSLSEDMIGKQLWEGLPEYLSRIAEEAIGYLSARKNQVFWKEYEFKNEHETRYAEVRFVTLYDGFIVSTHRDITERKRLEAAFLESESRFLSMAQNAADSIVIFNENGKIQFFNKTAETTFGYSQEEMLGQSIYKILPEHLDLIGDHLPQFFNLSTIDQIGKGQEFVGQTKSGQCFPCEVSLGMFKTSAGKMYNAIIRDISFRKLQEAEIFQYRNHLEDLVEKQTLDLKNAKEVAEEASNMKSLFLANISHELKTPIHAILSYAELGIERAPNANPEKIKEYFQIIDSSGKRLLDLLENLLDLSKLEAGKMKYVFETNCLKDTIRNVLQELNAILEKKQVSIELEDDGHRWEAEFDLERIQQVIRNIISNALKFVPEKTKIEIKKIKREYIPVKKDIFIQGIGVQIRDYGPGIPAEDLDKIFEKFIQSKQVKAGTKGTGLGLSISREIVNHHQGLLYADNHEEGGAIFTLILPISSGENV